MDRAVSDLRFETLDIILAGFQIPELLLEKRQNLQLAVRNIKLFVQHSIIWSITERDMKSK